MADSRIEKLADCTKTGNLQSPSDEGPCCHHTMRLRITFSKGGPLTYTSHLDLMRVWERVLRRTGVPMTYSQGFNPRPKLQLAAALPLGHTGKAELLDVWLERPTPIKEITRAIMAALPNGLAISQVRQVMVNEPALQTQIRSAEYYVTIEEWDHPIEELEARIKGVLAASALPQERRGRQYDLRPLIEQLWLERIDGNRVMLRMQLAAREGATARPEAVTKVLEMDNYFVRYHRQQLYA
jgi:radical SAM-linked protein